MIFTLEDFITQDVMKGYEKKNNIVINYKDILAESISVIELPIEDFVKKNEIVLSTCMGCQNNIDTFLDFISEIKAAGASALVVSKEGYIRKLPEEIIEYCDSIELPLIVAPEETRFSDIIESVYKKINDTNLLNIRLFENLQKKLLKYFLYGSTFSEAAEIIRQHIGTSVAIVNTVGTVKGESNNADTLLKKIKPALDILVSGKDLKFLDKIENNGLYDVYEIKSKNITYGYLYLEDKKIKSDLDVYISSHRAHINRHILSPITLWFDREQTIFETEMHFKDTFILDLINSEKSEYNKMINKGLSIGYDLSVPYIVMVGKVLYLEKSYGNNRSEHSTYTDWKFSCINMIKTEAVRIAKEKELQVLLTYHDDRFILLLESKKENVAKESNEFLDFLESKIKNSYKDLRFKWGISEKFTDEIGFKEAYLDGEISLEKGEEGNRNIYKNIGTYRLLDMISNNYEHESIVQGIIGNLIREDTNNKLELVKTFEAYINNNYNVSKTAREINLHRQSLLYRLEKINEITGLSLDDANDRFTLELCIRLLNRNKIAM